MKITRRRIVVFVLAAAALAAAVLALLPSPLPVETAPAATGPLSVSIDEEGRTRARDRYTVAAPIAGRLERVALRAGDTVTRGQELAVLHLAPLDPREREAAAGKVLTAEALKREAVENLAHAKADAAQAVRDRERAEQLHQKGYSALQELEQARNAEIAALKSAEAARFRVEAAQSEVAVAKAALLAGEGGAADEQRRISLRAPVDGRVLGVHEQSERVVPAGTPILEIGDASRLEIVVEALSTDAVRVRPGMPVNLAGWGGAGTLPAIVRTVEPAAFTKISALGVEEQRVNVIADLTGPPGPLGDGYRVEARIVTWSADSVLKVPASAVFRRAAGAAEPTGSVLPTGEAREWAVFTVAGGRAHLRPLAAGHRTAAEVEVLAGIAAGERVVLHPPNELRDGARVSTR
jgi:HlyD family secretion protein